VWWYYIKLKNSGHKASFKPGLSPIFNLRSQGPTRTLVHGGCVVSQDKKTKECGGCAGPDLGVYRLCSVTT